GGIIVIASVLAILLVIAGAVFPLFRKPAATLVGRLAATSTDARGEPAPGDSVGVDEYREIAFRITASGSLAFTALRGERALPAAAVPGVAGARVTAVTTSGASRYLLGTSDGRLIPLAMKFDVDFRSGARTVTPAPEFGEPAVLDGERRRVVLRVASATPSGGAVTVAQVGPRELPVQ